MNIKKLSLVLLLTNFLFTSVAFAMKGEDSKDFENKPTFVVNVNFLILEEVLSETTENLKKNKDNIESIAFQGVGSPHTKEVLQLLPTLSKLKTLDMGDITNEELPIDIINKIPSLKTLKCSIEYGDELIKLTKLNSNIEKIVFSSTKKGFDCLVSELPTCFKNNFSLKMLYNEIKSEFYPNWKTYDNFPELGKYNYFLDSRNCIDFNSHPNKERVILPSIGFISREYPLIRILPIQTLSQVTKELKIHYDPKDQNNVYWTDLFFQDTDFKCQSPQMGDKTITITRQSKKN